MCLCVYTYMYVLTYVSTYVLYMYFMLICMLEYSSFVFRNVFKGRTKSGTVEPA